MWESFGSSHKSIGEETARIATLCMVGGLGVRGLHLPYVKMCEIGSVFWFLGAKTVIKSCEKC